MLKSSRPVEAASATELISFDPISKHFIVRDAAVAILKKLTGPVAVISVCGRARMGKSTLLNQLLGKLTQGEHTGFTVASTHKPCTKGLWLWSKPIPRTAPDGTKMHLLLIDCEGIDAFDQTMDYSTQIFSLGVLMSSLLVFNQMGGIDESAIDKLSSVCEFAKLIQGKSAAPGSGPSSVSDLSPSFLWLLRDFQFQLNENGRQITTRDYMEETLADMPGASQAVQNRNQMRASVKSVFPDRDCFSLVRPCLEESQLANMDKLPLEQLRPEFRQGFQRLTDLVLTKAHPKQYKGQYLSGRALASFAQAYVDVINKGQVPAISSTWQSVMRTENQRALESAMAAYERAYAAASAQQQLMQSPSSSAAGSSSKELHETLDAAHASALQAALAEFEGQALGDGSEKRAFETKLREQADSRFAVVRRARLAEAERQASDLINTATRKITSLIHADPVDMAVVLRELESSLKQYDERAAGPSKYKAVAQFLLGLVRDNLAGLVTKASSATAVATTKLAAARKEAAEAQARAAELTHRVKSLDSSEASLRQQLVAVQQQSERLQQEVTDKGRSAVMTEAKRDALQSQLEQSRQRADRLEAKVASVEAALAEARGQASSQRGEAARAATDASERARELASVRMDLDRARGEAAQLVEVQGRAAQLGVDTNRLQSELAFMTSRRDAAETELASFSAEAARQLQSREANIALLKTEAQELRLAMATGQGSSQDQVNQLAQQLAERDTTIQRLQQERSFLQQQYDTLRRESLSPAFNARGAALQPPPDADMEEVEPERKRKRVTAARDPELGQGGTTPVPGGSGAAPAAPFSNERRVPLSPERGAAAGAAGAGPAVGRPELPTNLTKMTVQEIKMWLTEKGFEDAVFECNNRRPAVKKSDWAQLVMQKCEEF